MSWREWLFDYDPHTLCGFLWELLLIVPDALCAAFLSLGVGIATSPAALALRMIGVSTTALSWSWGIGCGIIMVWYLGFPRRRPHLWWLGNTKRFDA